MVTLCSRHLAREAGDEAGEAGARAVRQAEQSIGAFTAAEVMLTMRPKLRAIMPSTVALMSSIGVSMLASSALIQTSRSHSRKSPGGGPPALVTRMSGDGQRGERRRAALGRGDVAGDRRDLGAGRGADFRGGRLERARARAR